MREPAEMSMQGGEPQDAGVPPPTPRRSLRKLAVVAVAFGLAVGTTYVLLSRTVRVAGPASYAPLPWREGQWRRHRIVGPDGRETITRVAVTKDEAPGFWVEQQHTTATGGQERTRVLFAEQPFTPDQALDLARTVEIRASDGRSIDWNAASDVANRDTVQTVAAVVVSIAGLTETVPGELRDVVVAAGPFSGCRKADAAVPDGTAGRLMTGWFHPSVPLGGMVQAESTDGKYRMELLEYGVPPLDSR